MRRRAFFELIAAGLIGHTLDVDKLLWIPGQKTFFLPPAKKLHVANIGQIIAMELDRITPQIRHLFERDDLFYKVLESGHYTIVDNTGDSVKIPLKTIK